MKPHKKEKRPKQGIRSYHDIELLNSKIASETPPSGILYYKHLTPEDLKKLDDQQIDTTNQDIEPPDQNPKRHLLTKNEKKIKIRFGDLAISKQTSIGLAKAKYFRMTEIQRCCIPHALAGRNILGCSKTGSGKTLAFMIPLVQKLYRLKWSNLDKLGALVLLPTRELAIQVFETLKKFASLHEMSAGLVIGGKSLKEERNLIYKMNILISTPGRMLQHLQGTQYFDADNLKVLVFDEVDRMFDMGFQDEVTQILEYFPLKQLQLMFFSATVTLPIKRLLTALAGKFQTIVLSNSTIALKNEATEEAQKDIRLAKKGITPIKLVQHYMVIPIQDKLDVLFSFIRSHQKAKVLVFFSSCKQVRYAYQTFSRLKPGAKIMELHGRQKQAKRTAIFFDFTERHKSSYLFATDIASRGIDFPAVDWVIQVDCPQDVATYIHRVGRTARYKSKGNSLLFVTPQEIQFIKYLEVAGIPVKKVNPNHTSQLTIKDTLGKLLARQNELMHLAQKAFRSYVRSIFLMKDKQVFKLQELDVQGFADSLGLATAPQIKILNSQGEEVEDVTGEKKSKLQKLKEKIASKKKAKEQSAIKESQRTKTALQEKGQKQTEKSEEEEEEFLVPKKKKIEVRVQEVKEEEDQFKEVGLEKKKKVFENEASHYADLQQEIERKKNEDIQRERARVRTKHLKKKMKKERD